jgi:hypothetical protein
MGDYGLVLNTGSRAHGIDILSEVLRSIVATKLCDSWLLWGTRCGHPVRLSAKMIENVFEEELHFVTKFTLFLEGKPPHKVSELV